MNREVAAFHAASMFQSELGFQVEFRPASGGFAEVRALPFRHDVETDAGPMPLRQDVRDIRLPTQALEEQEPSIVGLETVRRGDTLIIDGSTYEVSEQPYKLEPGFSWVCTVHLR